MSFTLSVRSEAKLLGVHPDLVRVVRHAITISKCDFVVTDGLRTIEQQRAYFNAGKSKTMKSRHLTGHAVDLMPWLDTDGDGDKEGSWEVPHFFPIFDAMEGASLFCQVPLEFGAVWRDFKDYPHIQLPWSKYP